MTSARHCWCFGFAFQKRISEDRKTILIILPHVFCFLSALFYYLCKQARKHYAEYGYDQVSVHFFQNPAVLSVSRVMIHRCTIFKEHECHCFLSFLLYKCVDWSWNEDFPRATLSSSSDFSVQTLCTQLNWWSKIQVTSAVNYIWRSCLINISGALMFQPIWKRFNVT